MAYAGYLIKVGNYTIPANKFIRAGSYKATLSVLDLDSYRDANGVLHRTSLEHKVNKIEFETPAMLTNTEVAELMANIRGNYTIPAERRLMGTIYVPELDEYVSQDMYMADPSFTIYGIFDGVVKYNPIRIAFIAY